MKRRRYESSPLLSTLSIAGVALPLAASFCPSNAVSQNSRHERSAAKRKSRGRRGYLGIALTSTSTHDSSGNLNGSGASHGGKPPDPVPLEITVLDGPFSVDRFASSNCWGRRPLLIRSAFDVDSLLCNTYDEEEEKDCSWPSWGDVALLSCDEEGESRLISHRPDDPSSWELQLGPFEDEDVSNILSGHTLSGGKDDALADIQDKWTLVVNDVDRFFPSLADWMDQEYSFIPRWRRDDAQISLADIGGGIGPHVDNYDVFLIQMSGLRTWEVGKRFISVEEEYNSLVDGLDVRILSNWEDERKRSYVETFALEPGDALYLPPRIAHSGVALTNGCMTLSVGLRAPSATDMVSRIAEIMTSSVAGAAVERVTDIDLLDRESAGSTKSGEISASARDRARHLVRKAVEECLNDDDAWDKRFGQLVTESKRPRINYPVPLMDGDEEELGVWGNPRLAVAAILGGKGALYQAEGVCFGYTLANSNADTSDKENAHKLFVDGEVWDITASQEAAATFLQIVTSQRRIDGEVLTDNCTGSSSSKYDCGTKAMPVEFVALLEDLVGKGYLYGDDA